MCVCVARQVFSRGGSRTDILILMYSFILAKLYLWVCHQTGLFQRIAYEIFAVLCTSLLFGLDFHLTFTNLRLF